MADNQLLICQGQKKSGSGRSAQFFPYCRKSNRNKNGWVAVDPANPELRMCVHPDGACENGPYRFSAIFRGVAWNPSDNAQTKFLKAANASGTFRSMGDESLKERKSLQETEQAAPSSPSRENNWDDSAGESSDEDLESTASNIPVDKNPKTTAAQTTTVLSSSSLSSKGGSDDDSVPKFSRQQKALLDFLGTHRVILSVGEKRKLQNTIRLTDEKRAKVSQSRSTKFYEIQNLQQEKARIEAEISLKENQVDQDNIQIDNLQSKTARDKKLLAGGDKFVIEWMELVKAHPNLQAFQSSPAFAEQFVQDHHASLI